MYTSRTQCFCGDDTQIKQADEKDCNNKCAGDKRFNCGGDWRNSVYKTGNLGNQKYHNKSKYFIITFNI